MLQCVSSPANQILVSSIVPWTCSYQSDGENEVHRILSVKSLFHVVGVETLTNTETGNEAPEADPFRTGLGSDSDEIDIACSTRIVETK